MISNPVGNVKLSKAVIEGKGDLQRFYASKNAREEASHFAQAKSKRLHFNRRHLRRPSLFLHEDKSLAVAVERHSNIE